MPRLTRRNRVSVGNLAIIVLCLIPTQRSKSNKVVVPGFQAQLEAQSRKCRCWAEETVWQYGEPPAYLGDDDDFIEVNGNDNNMTLVSCTATTCQNFVNNLAATLCANHSGDFVRAHWWYNYYEGTTGPWAGTLDQDISCH